MSTVQLSDNRLTGTLPETFGAWRNTLHKFETRRNRLDGTLPAAYGDWVHLEAFHIQQNNFEGSLPDSYRRWTSLRSFGVTSNRLSGTLPESYSEWTQLTFFYVPSNALTGTFPSAYVVSWDSVASANRLNGTLPVEFGRAGTLLNLHSLFIDDNSFSGALPILSPMRMLPLLFYFVHGNPLLTGSLSSTTRVPSAFYVSLCGTRICGFEPLGWSVTTTFLCQETVSFANVSENEVYGLLRPLPKQPPPLLPCVLETPSPSSYLPPPDNRTKSDSAAGVAGDIANRMANVFSGIVVLSSVAAAPLIRIAGLHHSQGSIRSLQISMHAGEIARRVRACRGEPQNAPVDKNFDDAFVLDSPLQLTVPGALDHVGGTVVGNMVLLVAVPLVVALTGALQRHLRFRRSLRGFSVGQLLSTKAFHSSVITSALAVVTALQLPTVAAATQLLSAGVACSLGMVGVLVFVCIPASWYLVAVCTTR